MCNVWETSSKHPRMVSCQSCCALFRFYIILRSINVTFPFYLIFQKGVRFQDKSNVEWSLTYSIHLFFIVDVQRKEKKK